MKEKMLKFSFDENQLISYLSSFFKYMNDDEADEGDKGLIAEFVMFHSNMWVKK